jgi:Serine/threonine protein kinase
LSAFDFVHYNGIINRDIKSENIFWDGKNSVVVMDWTLAKNVDRKNLTVAGTRGGTPGHAPVKFMDGDFGNANFLDDYVNLGFVLWEFATYEFCPKISYEKYSDVHFEEYRKKIVDYLPDALQATFWKATECKEKDRYQSLKDFRESIEKAELYFRETGDNRLEIQIPETVEVNEKEPAAIMLAEIKDMCISCEEKDICKLFGCRICNQIVLAIQEMKREGII